MNDEKHTPNEDWEMSVSNVSASNVSPPEKNVENADGWKMPEPVFRVSEGDKVNKSELRANVAENVPTEDFAGEDEPFVQQQPGISEDFTISEIADLPVQLETAAAVKTEQGNTKWVVLLGGIFVFFAILVIIMLGVYFLFLRN